MILPGHCEHCGSGFIETNKDYIWHCLKCGRYEARPYKEDPVLNKIIGRQIEIKMQNRMCQNPKCNKGFETRVGSHRIYCKTCQGILDSREYRKKVKEGQAETV